MAHTCSMCGNHYRQFAVDIDDELHPLRGMKKYAKNHRYRHDCRGWKTTTKAIKQWDRHTKKYDAIPRISSLADLFNHNEQVISGETEFSIPLEYLEEFLF